MKDDSPLCGVLNCGPCRQSALGALRSDIAGHELQIQQNKALMKVAGEAVGDYSDDVNRIMFDRAFEELRARINREEDQLAVKRALEKWLSIHDGRFSRDVDEALWRYITRSPYGGF